MPGSSPLADQHVNVPDLSCLPACPLRELIATIDRNGVGMALVVDDEGRLLTTVTDGDVRRAILYGIDLEAPVDALLRVREARTGVRQPLTAPIGTPAAALLTIMAESTLRQIPLVDEDGRVADVALMDALVKEYELPLNAVVMAGGFGKRLHPLTQNVPKPMLPVGGKPLLEIILNQLRQAGIRRVNLSTHYKGDVIAGYFGDGRQFGVDIKYVTEERPLGTAGALALLEKSKEPLLVINGDILTRVDFRAMLDFHKEHRADMTVGVRDYKLRVPYGVMEIDGVNIRGLTEKPTVEYFINAGIYLLNPEVHARLSAGESLDMTELISTVLSEGGTVVGFPIHEYWLDIGQLDDYEQALSDMEGHRA